MEEKIFLGLCLLVAFLLGQVSGVQCKVDSVSCDKACYVDFCFDKLLVLLMWK